MASMPEGTNFVENMELIATALKEVKEALGFLLVPNCTPEQCFSMFRTRLRAASECLPGDLVFFRGHETKAGRTAPEVTLHVELVVRASDTEGDLATVGSLPWRAHTRTSSRDGVQIFSSHEMDETHEWTITSTLYFSLNDWIEADEKSYVHGQLVAQKMGKA